MACQTCSSERVALISGKCADRCIVRFASGDELDGTVPEGLGVGKGDYVRFRYCLQCGQIQGTFPIPQRLVESLLPRPEEEDEDEVYDPAIYDERGDGDNRIP